MPESMKHPARKLAAGAKELKRTGMKRKGVNSGTGHAGYTRAQVKGAQVNQSLSPPPTHEKVCCVLLDLTKRDADTTTRAIYGRRWYGEFTAAVLAAECGVEGARRLGNGAVKGSWSGTMSGALRIAPTLRAMERAGLLYRHYDSDNHRSLYGLTASGRKLAGEED